MKFEPSEKLVVFITLSVVFFLSGIFCRAESAVEAISGQVCNLSLEPVADAIITIIGKSVAVQSDDNGNFLLPVSGIEFPITIKICKEGYHCRQLKLNPENKKQNLKIILVPLSYLKEEINVTALNAKEEAWKLPFSSATVSLPFVQGEQNNNLTSLLERINGLNFIGKGGFTTTLSIRGLARQRVLILFNGARLTADRNAGVSATSIPMELAERIEVVKSAAGTIYGSDAIGGVVNFFPQIESRENFSGRLNFGWASASKLFNPALKLNYKKNRFLFNAYYQYKKASDYSSPQGRVVNSGYEYGYLWLNSGYQSDTTRLQLSYLQSDGKNIGRPDRTNSTEILNSYPYEKSKILQFNLENSTLPFGFSLKANLYYTPTSYSLEKRSAAKTEISETDSQDAGLRLSLSRNFGENFKLQFGFEQFQRRMVNMENVTIKGTSRNSYFSLHNGRRTDRSFFLSADYAGLKNFDLLAGFRYSWLYGGGEVNSGWLEKKNNNLSGFFSLSYQLNQNWSAYANYATSFRLPTFIEAFYIGISARGNTVGNPDLEPEKSNQLEAGIRYRSNSLQSSLAIFRCRLINMIEKIQLNKTTTSYANLLQAEIRGVELENNFRPVHNIECGVNFFYVYGQDRLSSAPINDIPPARLQILTRFNSGSFFGEVNFLHSFKFTHPGPAEATIPAFDNLIIKAGYIFNAKLIIQARLDNALNQLYYANPDPDIPYAKKIDLNLQLSYLF